MIWFSFFHLITLNYLIGYVESEFVTKWKVPNRSWVIIAGNYVSMFIGIYLIAPIITAKYGNPDFFGVGKRAGEINNEGFLQGMTLAFVATLIIEFPFFYLALKEKLFRKRLILPFIIANIITNIVMVLIYYMLANPKL